MTNGRRDPFESAVLKTGRAKAHITAIEHSIRDFLSRKPFHVARFEDHITGDLVWIVDAVDDPPHEIALLIGDAIHNLRTALDHVIWSLVVANGHTPTSQTMFPIMESEAHFHGSGLNRIKGISEDALRIMRLVQPFKPRNPTLWQLHKLDIIDKHRLILPVGSAYRSVVLDFSSLVRQEEAFADFPQVILPLRPANRLYPLRSGDALFRVRKAARSALDNDVTFQFEIVFGEGDIVDGEPVREKMIEFSDAVEHTISLFRPVVGQG